MLGKRSFCILVLLLAACSGTQGVSNGSADSAAPDVTAPTSSSPSSTLPPAGAGSATLSWAAPTENTDGTAVTDFAGYRVHYGTDPGAFEQTIDVAGAVSTSTVVSGLESGTYHFAVSAYNTAGQESELSNVANKTI